jgi:hypothetical protein
LGLFWSEWHIPQARRLPERFHEMPFQNFQSHFDQNWTLFIIESLSLCWFRKQLRQIRFLWSLILSCLGQEKYDEKRRKLLSNVYFHLGKADPDNWEGK